jgi:dolichol-phosphate mannosyltransferase
MLYVKKQRNLESLDIITSALNEEANILNLYDRLFEALVTFRQLRWNLHIVDNGSTDQTWSIIQKLAQEKGNVTGYKMSRTFLFDSAITTGLDHATADAVVIMCSDLQDPPELLPEMIRKFENGEDHVCVRIISRKGASFRLRFLTMLFYALAEKLTQGVISKNVSDFRFASKKCYEAARSLRESKRFIRGQFGWVGFSPTYLAIERPLREAGVSKFQLLPKWSAIWLALSAIFSHSLVPLFAVAAIGFFSSLLSLVCTIIFSLLWLFSGVPFAGFGTIVGVLSLGFSVLFLSIGTVALYLASVYEEVKNRPLYVIAEKCGKIET